jgi:hypothetical protein
LNRASRAAHSGKVPSSPGKFVAHSGATYARFAIWLMGGTNVKRILTPLVYLVAAIYFLVDAVFLTVARPLARRLADLAIFASLRAWIVSLHPYPTLALFMVPVALLEPVKPAAAFLAATGHVMAALALLLVGEILKLVLIERLFSVSRDKLMSIRAFAWCYARVCQARTWLESLKGWQLTRRLSRVARHAVRSFLLECKTSRSERLPSWQSR